jgi:hypothetical protein
VWGAKLTRAVAAGLDIQAEKKAAQEIRVYVAV